MDQNVHVIEASKERVDLSRVRHVTSHSPNRGPEFTDEQLDEIPLMMLFYAGAGNTTMTFKGIQAARANVKVAKKT